MKNLLDFGIIEDGANGGETDTCQDSSHEPPKRVQSSIHV